MFHRIAFVAIALTAAAACNGEDGAATQPVADAPVALPDGEWLSLSVSIGVATLDDFQRDHAIEGVAQQLVAQADQALYQAKENGRNQVVAAP